MDANSTQLFDNQFDDIDWIKKIGNVEARPLLGNSSYYKVTAKNFVDQKEIFSFDLHDLRHFKDFDIIKISDDFQNMCFAYSDIYRVGLEIDFYKSEIISKKPENQPDFQQNLIGTSVIGDSNSEESKISFKHSLEHFLENALLHENKIEKALAKVQGRKEELVY